MNLKLIESFVELIELGAFANKEDIVKGLNSAIKVTKKQAELSDEEIADFLYAYCLDMGDVYEVSEEQFIKCVRAILKEAQEK